MLASTPRSACCSTYVRLVQAHCFTERQYQADVHLPELLLSVLRGPELLLSVLRGRKVRMVG